MEYINGMEKIDLIVPEEVLDTLASMLGFACYVLPMGLIIAVIGFKLSFRMFRLTMAIIVRAKSFLPGMGA